MKCPNCGSENCQYITTTETHGGDEFAPDLVKKAIEESEKENYKKTGKLLVSDYVDVIDRTYF